jgi:hypothetical protein
MPMARSMAVARCVPAVALRSACVSSRVRLPSHRSPLISLPYRAMFPLRLRRSSVIW